MQDESQQSDITSTIKDRCSEWSEQIRVAAETLSRVSEQLSTLGLGPAADLVRTGSDKAHGLSSYLDVADTGSLLNDVEAFAERQPVLAMGGGFVLGMVAARMFKARGRGRSSGGRPSAQGGY